MLYQIFHIAIVSCICCIWGLPLALMAGKEDMITWIRRSQLGFIAFLSLSGAITLSILSSWLYLFLPLHFIYLLIGTCVLSLTLVLFYRKKIRSILPVRNRDNQTFPPAALGLLLLGLFLFVALSCLRPANGDTQIYHIQIIRWSSEYRAVPGLANLFLRLGLGSNWFGLISLFYLPFFKQGNFSYLNAGLTIWIFTWLLSNWKYHFVRWKLAASHKALCLFYFLLIAYGLFDWELFRDAANSTNYDLIVTSCILIAISFLLEQIEGTQADTGFSILFVLIAIAAVGFKFSGIFVFLLILYHLYFNRSLANCLVVIFLSFLIITPVLIRNYIITGYPLYPLSISINTPDWQVPKGMVNLLQNYIILSNRFYNQHFTNSYSFRKENIFWHIGWFKWILWQQKIIILLVLSSAVLLFKKTNLPINHRRLRQLVATLLLMAAGWFLTAPSPRFGYGALLCAAFIPVSLFIAGKIKPVWYTYCLLAASISIGIYLPGKAAVLARTPSCWIYPLSVEPLTYMTIPVNGIDFHLPEILYHTDDIRCIGTPLPCICQENPYLLPRGPSLQNGFRMAPSPDSTFIQNYKY